MTTNYRLSLKAENDLILLYQYGISEFGYAQAKFYFNEMQKALLLLTTNIELGRDASEFIPNLRRFTFKAHTIVYLTTDNGIFIIRVLGQRMDYANNL